VLHGVKCQGVWLKALPAALLAVFDAVLDCNVFPAADAAGLRVLALFAAMVVSCYWYPFVRTQHGEI